jgi:hypothetical protein
VFKSTIQFIKFKREYMKSITLAIATAAILLASGCASVSLESTQGLAVTTVDAQGKSVAGATCTFTNDKGQFKLDKTPGEAKVRRSPVDMDVICIKAGETEGTARLISRAGRMWGNFILGGGIGAIVDHSTGKGYNYPYIFEIVMGKFNEYDRHNQENDKAAISTEKADGVAPPPRTPVPPGPTAETQTMTKSAAK